MILTPIPEVGKFYTFVCNAKTPDITYDQHPHFRFAVIGFRDKLSLETISELYMGRTSRTTLYCSI